MRINFNILFLLAFITCNKEQNTDIPDDNNGNTNTEIGKGSPGIVGTAGVATWDALSTTEKNRVKGWNTLFLHQSVGQDLEEGCKANGFPRNTMAMEIRSTKVSWVESLLMWEKSPMEIRMKKSEFSKNRY
ncbi:MAG: hypothetical protein IPO37_11665 [Saprospiraceae bacterium]|nr:hypothetical protein [Saprospiraceae bacterium]